MLVIDYEGLAAGVEALYHQRGAGGVDAPRGHFFGPRVAAAELTGWKELHPAHQAIGSARRLHGEGAGGDSYSATEGVGGRHAAMVAAGGV